MTSSIREGPPPFLGRPAPSFEASSTFGPVKLSDYAGRWLVLFSYPADFTPVCGSELAAFARHSATFGSLRCSLLGVSVDSLEMHAAWIAELRREHGVSIDFPLIADVGGEIVARYGTLAAGMEKGAGVRGLFVVDPRGTLRAMLYYPCSSGRSVAEVLRLVQSLQLTERRGALTPEGWQPGQPTLDAIRIGRAPVTREAECRGCVDWYDFERPKRREELATVTARQTASKRATAASMPA